MLNQVIFVKTNNFSTPLSKEAPYLIDVFPVALFHVFNTVRLRMKKNV